ncbi:MAG: response regulator [Verrucomicrobiales bacterium]
MNRVLIVAGERQTGERFQQTLGDEGFQTAVVWNPMQMVDFCRQHSPDFMIVDLDLAEFGLWNGIQAVKGIGTLANIPFVGISSTGNPQLLEKAKAAGFLSVFPTHEGTKPVVAALKSRMNQEGESAAAAEDDVVSRDPSLNQLRGIARDIVQGTMRLKPNVDDYGDDGPELFGYIEEAGKSIRTKLNTVADFSLHDKELRHDFRNLIGSVTGFAELILMEPGLSPECIAGLTRLREQSKEFVEILDQQKAEASP